MRISLRGAAVILSLLGLFVASAAAAFVTHRAVLSSVKASASDQLSRAAVLVGEALSRSHADSLADFVRIEAQATGYRVSVLDADGAYRSDSDFLGTQLTDLAARARPEVQAALGRGSGASDRLSASDGRGYLFAAERTHLGGETVVLRLGLPTDRSVVAARRSAFWAALAVWGLGVPFLVFVWGRAGRVGAEIGRLGHYLRRMADQPAPPALELASVTELTNAASAATQLAILFRDQLAILDRELGELRDLQDQVAEGLLALTADARVLRINPAGKELLGVAEVIPFSPIGAIVRDPALREVLESSVVRSEIHSEVDLGGRHLQVKTSRTDSGGSVALLMDVSEVRRLEAVRSDFVANASHELKTPLTVIRGAAETVMDPDLPADLRVQFLQSIHGNAVRLQRLVDDLLDLSRFESGAWTPKPTLLDLVQIADDVWREVRDRAAEKNVGFRVSGRGTAAGDESAVFQVFQNLFDNALRYAPEEHGEVLVEISPGPTHVEVSVLDNGSGIPAAVLPRIFERFYRVDAARSREEGGTGLGLAIVRHLVTSMGGEAWAESTLGLGTTMRFTLPKALPSETE